MSFVAASIVKCNRVILCAFQRNFVIVGISSATIWGSRHFLRSKTTTDIIKSPRITTECAADRR